MKTFTIIFVLVGLFTLAFSTVIPRDELDVKDASDNVMATPCQTYSQIFQNCKKVIELTAIPRVTY